MTSIGIIGGAGYTAGELLRIVLRHPQVDITFVHSTSNAGNPLSAVHADLIGETDLHFTDQIDPEVEVAFICSGHGKSRAVVESKTFSPQTKIIDLSRDFRLKEEGNPFIYGLPELNREAIRESQFIANPGCFATCIQLGLLPLADAAKLQDEVHVHAITGSTGAGQNPSATTHFSWRNNNLSVYKAFTHQHLGEIRQSLTQLDPSFVKPLNFLPMRGDFARGIYASLYLNTDLSLEEAQDLYQQYYASHPFVVLSPSNPNLKQVVNTNKCVIHLMKQEGKLLIISMIDNLVKGASGQAVQNLNLIMGWSETTGLHLKAMAF